MQYHKIDSVYKRDMTKPRSPFIIGKWADLALEYLQNNQWVWEEKLDGMNIRIMFDGKNITFGGKSDKASIPTHLVNRLNELFLPKKELFKETFKSKEGMETNVCFYGEGIGYKIQGGIGKQYLGDNVDFILFDVRVGIWWLERENVYGIANKFGLKTPGVVGHGTLLEAIELVKKGFKSSFGTADAEGLVLRPMVELRTRSGQRVITKIKCRDFQNE